MGMAGCPSGSIMAAASIAPRCAVAGGPNPVAGNSRACEAISSQLALQKGGVDVGLGFHCHGTRATRMGGFAEEPQKARSARQIQCRSWSSEACRFNGEQVEQAAVRVRQRRASTTAAALRTSAKEDTLIVIETQKESENTFENAGASWTLHQDLESMESGKEVSRFNHGMESKPVVDNLASVSSRLQVDNTAAEEVETTVLLGVQEDSSDEFQIPSSKHNQIHAETESAVWKEAMAETAKVLHTKGSSLGQGQVYTEGKVHVQNATIETVKKLRSGQSSFVDKKSSNAQKRKHFLDGIRNTGFAKALVHDGRVISTWVQSAIQKTGVSRILAKDIGFIKTVSQKVYPSFIERVGEVAALRIIEDETAVPGAPSPWPQISYTGLRGSELVAADLKTLGSYASHFQGLLRSFQVPLQNEYDPDQVAAYFHRRPHVLIYRLVEVFLALGMVVLQRSLHKATLKRGPIGEISEAGDIELTLQTAESLKKALLGLGTTFIKVAQSLSSRPDLIGTETAKVLGELQDRLPPFPTSDAVAIIEAELGCSVSQAFSFLSKEPVAAASFGQVYRGRTISGEDVAVKVQRPNLLFAVARDVYILRIGMGLLKKVANLTNNYTLLADELGEGLYGELDYRREASNAAEFAMAHKHVPWVYVPKTLPHMTWRKVLVMEWLNGDRPFDLQCVAQGLAYEDGTYPTQENQQEAKRRLLNMVDKGTESALVQLLETGVMHADPHPGNILLGRDGQLQFIDFGLICHMEKKHQDAMLASIAHLVNGDWQSLTDDLADMDVVKPTTDRFAVRLALERAFGEGPDAIIKDGIPDPNFSLTKLTKRFFKIAYKFRFRIPPYYTLVLRSLASLEGFGLAVNPEHKTFASAYPYAVRRVLLDYTPTTQRVLRSLLLTEKGEFKWDRISTLLAISQKSSADRAALEIVTVPDAIPENKVTTSGVMTGEENSQQSVGNIAGLLFSRQGVGIRRVIYEADAQSLALVFASTYSAKFRRKVAEHLGEALFIMFREKSCATSTEGSSYGVLSPPQLVSDKFSKDKRLQFLLKSLLGRLRTKPFLVARVGWTFVTLALWALALACHKYAIFVSNLYLEKSQAHDGQKYLDRVSSTQMTAT